MKNSKSKIQNPKLQYKIKNFEIFNVILIFAFCILNFMGCAGLKETSRGFLGVSTKILEEKRAQAEVIMVDYDYFNCYQKVKDWLRENDSYIYAKRDDLIAFYVSDKDTTPVGVFFKEDGPMKTKLEISSPSERARKAMAKEIAAAFRKEVTVTFF